MIEAINEAMQPLFEAGKELADAILDYCPEPDDFDGKDIESATYDELELQNALSCLKE